MKQSTFSAVMANSIKNLLQGYTKGIRFVAVLTVLLTMGIGQAWGADPNTGYSINYPYFYYYNSADWNNCMVLYGRKWDNANWTVGQNMSKVTGTKLYYAYIQTNWNKTYNQIAILNAKDWGGEGNNIENRWTHASAHTDKVIFNYNLNYQNTYLWDGKSAITITYYSNGYSGLNHDQTIYKYTSTDNGSSYSAKSVNSGTVTISAYKMTGNGTASNSSNSKTIDAASTTSTSVSAAYTGEVTVTATANSGYTFVGWFESTSATTAVLTSASYTYNAPNTTKSLYARFKAVQSAVTLNANGGTGGTASVTATYGQAMPSATMPTREGYTFNGYFDATSGGTKYYNEDGTSAKNWDKTSATTLYAQWTGNKYTITWVVDAVELTGAQLDGVTTIVNHGDKIATAPKVVVEDYCGDIFVGWTDAVGGEYEHGRSNLYTTEFPTITNDITLYAVFADYKK